MMESAELVIPVNEQDHSKGPDDAPLTLVQYGDFECPYCGMAYPIIKDVQERLGDNLRFVFRNFPITTSHPHAVHAAEAAESAGAQGKFWEMHDTLYENQDSLDDDSLRGYAEQLGLDLDRFDRDMIEHRYENDVREDFMGGVRSGVGGTPTFYINGVRYDGNWTGGHLHRALEQALG